MNKVFKLIRNNHQVAIIEVIAKDAFTCALYPYISAKYKYITVTKGYEASGLITITYTDGSTFSFSNRTIVSHDTKLFRAKVTEFLHQQGVSIYNNR